MSSSLEAKHTAEEAKNKLWAAVRQGCYKIVREARKAWNGSEAYLYRDEKRIIMNHIEPFRTGAFVTIFIFATFRISGSQWWNRTRNELFTFSRASANEARSLKKAEIKQSKEWKSYLERKTEELNIGGESYFWQLSLDFLLTILCGTSTIVWFFDPKEFRKDLAEIPLVSGRSLVHTCVCADVQKVYLELDGKVFQENTNDEGLQTLHQFVQNCNIRSEFIRSKQNVTSEEIPVIPYPGLAKGPR